MWVIYFNIGAERASRLIASSERSRTAGAQRLHLSPHPDRRRHHRRRGRRRSGAASPGNGHNDIETAAVLIGGPALYLLGNPLFKRLSAPNLPLSHLVGLGCSRC